MYNVVSCCILISVVGRFCGFFFEIILTQGNWLGGSVLCHFFRCIFFYVFLICFKLFLNLLFNLFHFFIFVVVVLYCVQMSSEELFISIGSVFSWAILILNNVFVVVVLYCVQLFFGSKNFPKSFSPFLFLSFANTFLFFSLSSILLN